MPSSAKKKSIKNLSWQDTGIQVFADYLKKVKAPKGSLLLFNPYGDLLLQGGKVSIGDSTALGSLFSSAKAVVGGLDSELKAKTKYVSFGENYWLSLDHPQLFVVGVKCPHKWPAIKNLKKFLGRVPTGSGRGTEALEGMTEASIEAMIEGTKA